MFARFVARCGDLMCICGSRSWEVFRAQFSSCDAFDLQLSPSTSPVRVFIALKCRSLFLSPRAGRSFAIAAKNQFFTRTNKCVHHQYRTITNWLVWCRTVPLTILHFRIKTISTVLHLHLYIFIDRNLTLLLLFLCRSAACNPYMQQ